jgi:hypothetical protein
MQDADRRERGLDMLQQYGRIECRVCGEQVIVPLPTATEDGKADRNSYELTCSKGHTDSYDLTKMESISSKPATSLKFRRAITGMG